MSGPHVCVMSCVGGYSAGMDLSGANLYQAVTDEATIWPCGFDPEAAGVIFEQALLAVLRVAHFIAQNAHHHTDTDVPDRHASLIPRALRV